MGEAKRMLDLTDSTPDMMVPQNFSGAISIEFRLVVFPKPLFPKLKFASSGALLHQDVLGRHSTAYPP